MKAIPLHFIVITTITFLLEACTYTSRQEQGFNLDFERSDTSLPIGWTEYGHPEYMIKLDSSIAQHGNRSVSIENMTDMKGFKTLTYPILDVYQGKEITLSGYIKTENVTEGYAGLYLMMDHDICMETMSDRGVTGTTDWTKYEITAKMDPYRTQLTVVGGVLIGKGKVWFDNFSITIDGKKVETLSPIKMVKLPDSVKVEENAIYQYASKIQFPDLNEEQIQNLELLGRLWGFLKYHHPAVTSGKYNWDYELFRILPDYLKVENSEERDKLLLQWVNKLGKVKDQKVKPEHSGITIVKPDLEWVEKLDMNSELRFSIENIYKNRNYGEQYYINPNQSSRPFFSNENAYSILNYPDDGYRLLALYRFWNVIHYFFPYRDLTDTDWNTILKIFIPKFISASNELNYELTVKQLVTCINDSHGGFIDFDKCEEWNGSNYAPFRVRFVEDEKLVVDYLASAYKNRVNIKVGDVITHIQNKSINVIIDSIKEYYPASNRTTLLRNASRDLLRSKDTQISITYNSLGKQFHENIDLFPIRQLITDKSLFIRIKDEDPCYRFLNDQIGYVNIANIRYEDISRLKEAFRNTKGLIIDVRNYPPFGVHTALGTYFVSDTASILKFGIRNPNNPGEFILGITQNIENSKLFVCDDMRVNYKEPKHQGKVVILVDEETQSLAEFTTMVFKAGTNATVLGSPTAGTNGDIATIYLPGGLGIYFTSIGVYYPDGSQTQRIGIIPDILVKPTVEGIRQGRDELLEKAIEIIEYSILNTTFK